MVLTILCQVLLVEGLVGVLLPVVLKITVHAGWLLSLINCFAGGVFFSFGAPLRNRIPDKKRLCQFWGCSFGVLSLCTQGM